MLTEKIHTTFLNSINDKQYGGLCYIADYHETLRGGIEADDYLNGALFEFYAQSAGLGNAMSYFRLSSMYLSLD
jgi:hypothetical protein